MKKIVKWVLIVLGGLFVVAFLAFLYFIPPFTLIPQEEFIQGAAAPAPSLDHITNPVERLMAERGKHIVLTSGCTDCHTPQGEEGPIPEKFLAGGIMLASAEAGTVISRNLTPHETGLKNRTDEQIMRVLRNGIFHTGRTVNHRAMPWPAFSQLSEEDLRAVIVFLRYLRPIAHEIPDPDPNNHPPMPEGSEGFFGGDNAKH
jgi:mono/diheme cytochrome c family protein